MVRVNLSETEGFDPIPAGRYPLNVFDGEVRTSGENANHPGSQYIAWDFTVASGDFEDRHIWTNTVIDHGDCECGDAEMIARFEKGKFMLMDLLKATGKWSEEELRDENFDFEIEDVVGSTVSAAVGVRKSEEYGDQNTIKKIKALSESELASTSTLP